MGSRKDFTGAITFMVSKVHVTLEDEQPSRLLLQVSGFSRLKNLVLVFQDILHLSFLQMGNSSASQEIWARRYLSKVATPRS